MSPRALIVEDDKGWQDIIKESLESIGIENDLAPDRMMAKQLTEARTYDLAIIDILLEEEPIVNRYALEGAKAQTANMLISLQRAHPGMKCIILTQFGTLEFAINAFRKLGVSDFFVKDSFDVTEFLTRVSQLLDSGQSSATARARQLPGNADSFLSIELEKRKREQINHINSFRKQSDDILVTIRSKRIAAKGNKDRADDDEWIDQQRKILDERYRKALARIRNINSLDDVESVQLWIEKECNDWLGLSAG